MVAPYFVRTPLLPDDFQVDERLGASPPSFILRCRILPADALSFTLGFAEIADVVDAFLIATTDPDASTSGSGYAIPDSKSVRTDTCFQQLFSMLTSLLSPLPSQRRLAHGLQAALAQGLFGHGQGRQVGRTRSGQALRRSRTTSPSLLVLTLLALLLADTLWSRLWPTASCMPILFSQRSPLRSERKAVDLCSSSIQSDSGHWSRLR